MNEFNNKSHAQIEKKIKKRNYVPRGWRIRKIKEISEVLRGASPRPISDPKWFSSESNIGWVRISDVTKSKKILRKTEQYVSKEGMRKSRLVKKDNIIMSIAATVGKPIYTGFDVCIHDGFVVFNNLKVNKEYFYYLLESKEKQWGKYGQTGSQMNLNSSIVGNETVLIPDDELEQQKIAKILSTWDKAIELKEKLIEQKKELKKGLMQKLLTGEVRLPGFDGEWKVVQIGDLSKVVTGNTPSTQNVEFYDNGTIPWITPTDISESKYISDSERKLTEKGLDNGRLIPKGSLLVTCIGSIGKNAILTRNGSCNQQINAIFPSDKHSNEFLYYKLELEVKKMEMLAGKTSTPIINKSTFEKYKIKIPEFNEQRAIAEVLSEFDRNIELLINEIKQLKLQKKGLMQLLLTGKVRVKV